MRKSKYPLSFRIAMIFVGILFVVGLFVIPSRSAHENVLPDMELPWNKSEAALIETLNKIYQLKGQPAEWALCEVAESRIYQMCTKDFQQAGPFEFVFSEGRLVGYLAEFSEKDYATLVYSADVNYPKNTKGIGRSFVKTKSREFRVYEKEMKFGHLELYMVWDKDSLRVRLQAKYKHTGRKDKKSEAEDKTLDSGKQFLESDVTGCLAPRPKAKTVEEAIRPHIKAALLKILCS